MASTSSKTTPTNSSPAIRIVIIGMCGSGKSTLAKQLADALGIAHVELDRLHFRDDWVEVPWPEFRSDVEATLRQHPSCTVDGFYSHVLDLTLSKATHLVYLDYGFFFTFARLLKRTVARCWAKEELFGRGGCVESFSTTFFDREKSILWFFLRNWSRNKKTCECAFVERTFLPDHALVLRFTRHEDTQAWLELVVRDRALLPL